MKTVFVNGSYTISCNLNSYPILVNEDEFAAIKALQEDKDWDALDALICNVLEEDNDVISLGDAEFEGNDFVTFGKKEE